MIDRYSLAFLGLPERDESMRRMVGDSKNDESSEGGELTAWGWEIKKAMALKRDELVTDSKGGGLKTARERLYEQCCRERGPVHFIPALIEIFRSSKFCRIPCVKVFLSI